MKICVKCHTDRPLSEYYSNGPGRPPKNKCKWCCKEEYRDRVSDDVKAERLREQWRRASNKQTRETDRAHKRRLARYGISQDEFSALRGEGMCAICGSVDDRMAIDHCHATSKVRGYLCLKCNSGLGMFNDDIDTLQRAIEYLSKFAE